MTKHRLMLSAAVTAVLATPVLAAGPTTITTVQKSAISTSTDGDTTINSGGGVQISAASAAVTVNSSNFLNNGGTISNTNTTNAQGILIDATNGPYADTSGVTNSGTIDLSGNGDTKTALELTGGTYTGPITLTSSSVIKVTGNNSLGVLVNSGATLNGDMTLSGSIDMTPTTANATATGTGSTIAEIAGTVNGNVLADASAAFQGTGQGVQGIYVGPEGSICNANGCAATGAGASTTDIGTLTNEGNVTVEGVIQSTINPLTGIPNNLNNPNTVRPESGSALIVSGNVQGGIVNDGPVSQSDTTAIATFSASGLVPTSGAAAPTVLIGPTTTAINPISIGVDSLATSVDPNNPTALFSFINHGDIIATPLNSNNSSMAMQVTGVSGEETTLSGGIFTSGEISATATSATGTTTAANPTATAIDISSFASVPSLVVSGESVPTAGSTSTNGTITASVSGELGGVATAIRIDASGTPAQQVGSGLGIITVEQYAKVTATATTTEPDTTTTLNAIAIVDSAGTVTTINNAGTISATVTELTPNEGVTVTSNVARAIDLSANTMGGITINNAGTIVGDVFLNQQGNGTVFNVGAGTYTCSSGTCTTQNTAAQNAVAATGLTNTATTPATVSGTILNGVPNVVEFGSGQSTLNVNDFGYVSAQVTSLNGLLDVNVSEHGTLTLTNVSEALVANNFTVSGGTVNIPVSETLRENGQATITAKSSATLEAGTVLGVSVSTFVPQSTNGQAIQYVLINAPGTSIVGPADLQSYQSQIIGKLPYYFDQAGSSLEQVSGGLGTELAINLLPKTAAQLGISGQAAQMFPYANAALISDPQLGAAVINGMTNQAAAQQIYSQFAPDVSGDVRDEAIALTDSATGPVAARQRLLRNYADQDGSLTLWSQEFAQYLNNKGSNGPNGTLSQYKSHGFGFALGGDSGDPDDGWYGAAFTFFAGDATQSLPADSKNQTEWYMLSGYTDWKGAHLFLDTQASIAYGDFRGKRFMDIALPNAGATSATQTTQFLREADGKRAGLMGALGATLGAQFNWGSTVLMPQLSLDGLTMREEGYQEVGGGDGFDLAVSPYYANSLRGFLGTDIRQDIDLGDFVLQPEGRVGYRYDFLNDSIKTKAYFLSVGPTSTFTSVGPDPTRGDFVAGATLGASTDTWSLGLNFDWVRGANGSTTEVGTFSLLGRI